MKRFFLLVSIFFLFGCSTFIINIPNDHSKIYTVVKKYKETPSNYLPQNYYIPDQYHLIIANGSEAIDMNTTKPFYDNLEIGDKIVIFRPK